MANYNDNDELDDEFEENDQPIDEEEEEGEARPAGNRNFILALGILGAIFLLLVLALVAWAIFRPGAGDAGVTAIEQTNAAIYAMNTQTAGAATQAAIALLTPSATPTSTVTPTATNTQVVVVPTDTAAPGEGAVGEGTPGAVGAEGTATAEAAGGGPGVDVPTDTPGGVGQVDTRTATVGALLTQRAETAMAQTQAAAGQATNTPIAGVTIPAGATATRLPDTGFAEDVGLPGLFGMALGLVLVIVLVRRLRLSPNH